jgi:hypothetical protein
MQLHKQLTKPARLCHAVGHNAVLRLRARAGDDVLTLRGLGDEVVTQEHRVARSGPTSVETTGPVSISVDDEVRRRGAAKKKAVAESALEVPKDALHGREMGLTRVVHVEAHLLDHIGNVGPGEGEVLESPSQTTVGSQVTDGGPHVGGDLDLSADRRGTGLTVAHASTLKDVPSILELVEDVVAGTQGGFGRSVKPMSCVTKTQMPVPRVARAWAPGRLVAQTRALGQRMAQTGASVPRVAWAWASGPRVARAWTSVSRVARAWTPGPRVAWSWTSGPRVARAWTSRLHVVVDVGAAVAQATAPRPRVAWRQSPRYL